MALIRTSTSWFGSQGAPYYTETYWLGAGDLSHANDAIGAIASFINSIAYALDDAMTVVVSGDVAVIDVATGQQTAVLAGTEQTVACTGSGDVLPPANQLLCRFFTGTFINGRQLRGRMFIPGILEANSGPTGQPSGTFPTNVQGALDVLVADSAEIAVYSRTHGSASSVQSSSVWNQFAVLRSRRD